MAGYDMYNARKIDSTIPYLEKKDNKARVYRCVTPTMTLVEFTGMSHRL